MAITSRKIGKYEKLSLDWNDIKEGIHIRVHTSEWFDKYTNADRVGDREMTISLRNGGNLVVYFNNAMSKLCGQEVVVSSIGGNYFLIYDDPDGWCWYPEMFECAIK